MSKITYPLTLDGIEFSDTPAFIPNMGTRLVCGDFVSVRPCAEEYKGKTFLGIFIGEVAIQNMGSFKPGDKKILKITPCLHNPMIYVPELKKVIFGYESWWGKIKDEAHLKQITDEDIGNVWYVKALKQMQELAPGPTDLNPSEPKPKSASKEPPDYVLPSATVQHLIEEAEKVGAERVTFGVMVPGEGRHPELPGYRGIISESVECLKGGPARVQE